MRKIAFLYLLLCLVSSVEAGAQFARIYSSDTGLPSNQVNCVFQDREGYIWFATQEGLARFNGMDFETFRNEGVMSFFEDSKGTKWVGTAVGLRMFDAVNGTFLPVPAVQQDDPAVPLYIADVIEASTSSGIDDILFATSSSGVFVLNAETRELNKKKMDVINAQLASPYLSKLFLDSHERLWIASPLGGITLINYNSDYPENFCSWSDELLPIADKIVATCFAEDPVTHNIYIGTQNNGILVYDGGKLRQSRTMASRKLDVTALLYNRIQTIAGRPSFIVGTESSGFHFFEIGSEEIVPGHFSSIRQETGNWKIHALFEDNQGNVWMAAYQTGAVLVPKPMYGFDMLTMSQRGVRGENSACVSAVFRDTDNRVTWVGTDGAGLFRIHDGQREQCFCTSNSDISSNSIMAVCMDRHGKLWVGTYQDGICIMQGNTFRTFRDPVLDTPKRIKTFAYDYASDRLYVATSGDGLMIIDPKTETIENIVIEQGNRWVSDLCIDHTGIVWIGTYNGPMKYDPESGRIHAFDVSENFEDVRVYAISESEDGMIWFGTGKGLFGIHPVSRTKITLTEDDGLCNNSIKDILCADGSVWAATGRGLSRYDRYNGKFTNYYAADGLQGNEFHTCTGFISSDKQMFFGGSGGLTQFYPHNVERDSHSIPPVKITRQFGSNDSFSCSFSALEYTNPAKVNYDYMLEGVDDGWRHAGLGFRAARYSNLTHGNYTLRVRAFFDGKEDEFSEETATIHIPTPLYLSWWAVCLYVAFLLFLLHLIGTSYKSKKLEMRSREETRMQEVRLSMFTNMTHEIRTPLNLVMSPLKKLRENESDPRQKDTYNLMYRNCLRVNRIVNQLMDIRKIDDGQMHMHFVETDVIFFIRDIMQSFEELASDNNILFELSSDREAENLWIDQGNFDKIIFNILSNAFKYTPENGQIRLYVTRPVNGSVRISIYNSGSSIEEKNLDRVFDRFFQASADDMTRGSGVGLNLAKMLVDLHHGTIAAANRDDGVEFSVTLPAGNAHLTREELSVTNHHKDLYNRSSSRDEVGKAAASDSGFLHKAKTKKSVIVVEDDIDTREYLRRELAESYNVTVCENGREAWAEITRTLPDAVITDLVMPEMDGIELCSKIRHNQSTNHIPVIFLTAQRDEDTEKTCTDAGADKFYCKPVSVDVLLSGIAQVVRSRSVIKGKYENETTNDYSDISMKSDRNKLYGKVLDYIRGHIDDPELSVEKMSADLGMSRVHLNRKLKEAGSASPNALVKSIRLKQAASLLVHNKVNVSEVAFKVGFTTHSYFTRAFRDYFGMSPKDFVNKYQNDLENPDLKRLLE